MITEKTLKKAVNELLKVRWPDIRRYGIEVTEGYIPPCFFVNMLLLSEEDTGANTGDYEIKSVKAHTQGLS